MRTCSKSPHCGKATVLDLWLQKDTTKIDRFSGLGCLSVKTCQVWQWYICKVMFKLHTQEWRSAINPEGLPRQMFKKLASGKAQIPIPYRELIRGNL